MSLLILIGTNEARWRFKKPMIRMSLIGLCLILLGIILLKVIGNPHGIRPIKDRITKGDLSTIANALERFEINCERLPTTEEGLKALLITPTNTTGWNGPYLTREPIDPWGHIYKYRFSRTGENKNYDIWSMGADGKDGTEDDIIWKK